MRAHPAEARQGTHLMTSYVAPLRDITFALEHLAGLGDIARLPGFEEASADLVDSVLTEAAKIAEEVLGPLNQKGDRDGARLEQGAVRTTPGWDHAWQVLAEGGWVGLPFAPDLGGMGLPNLVNTAVQEMWQSSNMAFGLCPMLTQGAVNAIEQYGSADQKRRYLPNMVSGRWTGTMNITEPVAGSDLAAVRTRAVPEGDHYRISGQKIFITYGDHQLTDNIIHLVLARLPDAPPGVKGISLFIVPKVLLDADGEPSGPNDVHCVSLEHKLGIHGSPTAVLSFGDHGGAVGELVGEPNRGLEYMFSMMNHARQAVGLQGLAIAERAYQQALNYARERVQGKPLGWTGNGPAGIVHHPDVRRMLLSMKSRIEAMRGILYTAAAAVDLAHAHPDAAERQRAGTLAELLTPIAKGWCTEMGVEIASLGVQIHGGMGFIEETGAAQHYRDSRITTIYEGTTGIQANDLVGRKVLRDGGAAARSLLGDIAGFAAGLDGSLKAIGAALGQAAARAGEGVDALLAAAKRDPRLPFAVAVPFLHQMGIVVGGYQLARGAVAAERRIAQQQQSDRALGQRLAVAQFYTGHILPQAEALAVTVLQGAEAVVNPDEALF
jgi:alkylation response protein AidB-like acyl-CoA dehydrogenase